MPVVDQVLGLFEARKSTKKLVRRAEKKRPSLVRTGDIWKLNTVNGEINYRVLNTSSIRYLQVSRIGFDTPHIMLHRDAFHRIAVRRIWPNV